MSKYFSWSRKKWVSWVKERWEGEQALGSGLSRLEAWLSKALGGPVAVTTCACGTMPREES